MNNVPRPLVSVITPVYNGAEYLAECIESVLAQTYQDWDYTIVNNRSTDASLTIAREYAARDPRIRVVDNELFLPIIDNHNHAVRHISPNSKYCKFVFADDWLYPTCLEEMVRTAEQNPSVGLVGAYTTDGRRVLWPGIQYPGTSVPGNQVCRASLLGREYIFGSMTSLLVRSDLCWKREPVFNPHHLQADVEFCFNILQESGFGFVHQVLSFSRPQEGSTSSFAASFNTISLGEFIIFLKYGPVFLSPAEYRQRRKQVTWAYHRVLAHNILRGRSRKFWKYHRDTLAAHGFRFDRRLIAVSLLVDLWDQFSHPITAVRKAWPWWSQAIVKIRRGRIPRKRVAGRLG